MSMYESAQKINNDLNQLFNSCYIKEFTKEQRERILNIMIRFGAVAKFRCRSNTAYDNFVNACFNNIANCKRVPLKEGESFTVLQAELTPLTSYTDYLYKNNLEDKKTSYMEWVNWVRGGEKKPEMEVY